MSTWGDRLGMNGRPSLGFGRQIPPGAVPQQQSVVYGSFSGINESDAPTAIPFSAGILGTIDIEMSPDNTLIRAPGILLVEDSLTHSFKYVTVHTASDGSVELLVFDSPDIGVRTAGVTTWTNVALPAAGTFGWVAANHGGVVLFSNGVGNGYARHFGLAAIESLADMPAARTIASTFARAFVGAPLAGGAFDNLRIQWSGASGAYNDWLGTGSGSELLLNDLSFADRIVALRPHGRDILCILLRHSIWVGVPTGELSRPADFRSVKAGVGCVTEPTARTTSDGVAYLSDDGVHIFDGNDDVMISPQINQELLPIDYNNLAGYHAAYDPYRKRYILTTPAAVWVYEFPVVTIQRPARWYKRSFIADAVFSYSDQAANPTWDDSADTWDTAAPGSWDTDTAAGLDAPSRLFFGSGSKLGREDYSSTQNFGVDFNGVWRGTPINRDDLSSLITIHSYEIQYRGAGRVALATPDADGNWVQRLAAVLPQHGKSLLAELIENLSVGVGGGLQITLEPPGAGDVVSQNLVISDGQVVTLLSTTDIPGDIVVEVLSGGTLLAIDEALNLTTPEISGIRVRYTPTGPKNSGGVLVL